MSLRSGLRTTFGLILARLEPAFLTTTLGTLIAAVAIVATITVVTTIAVLTIATEITALTGFAVIEIATTLTLTLTLTLATLATIGTERRALFALRRLRGCCLATGGLPTHRGALGLFWGQNLQLWLIFGVSGIQTR